jgi:hypothetical protein
MKQNNSTTKPSNNKKPSTPENRGGLTNFSVSGVDTKILNNNDKRSSQKIKG